MPTGINADGHKRPITFCMHVPERHVYAFVPHVQVHAKRTKDYSGQEREEEVKERDTVKQLRDSAGRRFDGVNEGALVHLYGYFPRPDGGAWTFR